jgi:hypothetical protein
MEDPWDDKLASATGQVVLVDGVNSEERISSQELMRKWLGLSADKQNDGTAKRLRNSMHRLGWQGPKKMRFETETWNHGIGEYERTSVVQQGYWRSPPGA